MFIYKNWDNFCRSLYNFNIISTTAQKALSEKLNSFLILKHDVETSCSKALVLARIEAKYGHCGVYYVQAYLLKNKKNIEILKQIQALGHEVSYHHDVMDSNSGNIEKAVENFTANVELFKCNGFDISTVCQHGNPIANRSGYNSNRDFFRNKNVCKKFQSISEIMVNYKERMGIDYKYISDAGYGWKIIYDPENNDIYNSDDKNITIDSFDKLLDWCKEGNYIISTHPHRWYSNRFYAGIKNMLFKMIKNSAKIGLQIPLIKKVLEKFYFIAKKI